MNILIKLMSIVSLVIAPTLAQIYTQDANHMMGSNTQMESTSTTNSEVDTYTKYTPFLNALERDGFYSNNTRKISIVGTHIVIDNSTMDSLTAVKYLPLLNGETNIELEFN